MKVQNKAKKTARNAVTIAVAEMVEHLESEGVEINPFTSEGNFGANLVWHHAVETARKIGLSHKQAERVCRDASGMLADIYYITR
jgi:arginyl-tRNA synthetase